MKSFIKQVFSEEGQPSSKRLILFILLVAFLVEIFVNIFSGKAAIAEIREELFYAFSGALATVFGSNVLNVWKDVKTTQSANNAAVGAPSPAPEPPVTETTIVKQ